MRVTCGLQIPYRVSADSGGNVKLLSSNAKKDFSPEEISALVLRKLVDDAANFLNDKVGGCTTGLAVIAVLVRLPVCSVKEIPVSSRAASLL